MRVAPADWAVLIYSSGSRDIEQNTRDALAEVAAAPLADRVVVGAQLGTAEETLRLSLPAGTRETLAPVDMAAPASLKDFLRWGIEKFPARHYAVVLGGHSGGFLGAITDANRSKLMRLPDLAAALGEVKPDLVVFNSCLMAQAEVATELAPVAGHLVASQAEEKGLGMPLGAWLSGLAGEPAAAAASLARECASSGERAPHVSAFDLSADVASPLDGVAGAILAHPGDREALREDIAAEPAFWPKPYDHPLSDYKDARGLLSRWASDARLSPEVRSLCREADLPAGMSVYAGSLPLVEPIYDKLAMARQTRWEDAMRTL